MKRRYFLLGLIMTLSINNEDVFAGMSSMIYSENSEKVRLLNRLSTQYLKDSDFLKSEHYAKEALETAKQIQYKLGQTNALLNLVELANNQSEYSQAIQYLELLLPIIETDNGSATKTLALLKKGQLYHNLGNYDEALSSQIKALKHAISNQNRQKIGQIYLAIAKTYQQKNNTSVANDFLRLYHKNNIKSSHEINHLAKAAKVKKYYAVNDMTIEEKESANRPDPLLVIFGIVFFLLAMAFIVVFIKLMGSIKQNNKQQNLMNA